MRLFTVLFSFLLVTIYIASCKHKSTGQWIRGNPDDYTTVEISLPFSKRLNRLALEQEVAKLQDVQNGEKLEFVGESLDPKDISRKIQAKLILNGVMLESVPAYKKILTFKMDIITPNGILNKTGGTAGVAGNVISDSNVQYFSNFGTSTATPNSPAADFNGISFQVKDVSDAGTPLTVRFTAVFADFNLWQGEGTIVLKSSLPDPYLDIPMNKLTNRGNNASFPTNFLYQGTEANCSSPSNYYSGATISAVPIPAYGNYTFFVATASGLSTVVLCDHGTAGSMTSTGTDKYLGVVGGTSGPNLTRTYSTVSISSSGMANLGIDSSYGGAGVIPFNSITADVMELHNGQINIGTCGCKYTYSGTTANTFYVTSLNSNYSAGITCTGATTMSSPPNLNSSGSWKYTPIDFGAYQIGSTGTGIGPCQIKLDVDTLVISGTTTGDNIVASVATNTAVGGSAWLDLGTLINKRAFGSNKLVNAGGTFTTAYGGSAAIFLNDYICEGCSATGSSIDTYSNFVASVLNLAGSGILNISGSAANNANDGTKCVGDKISSPHCCVGTICN